MHFSLLGFDSLSGGFNIFFVEEMKEWLIQNNP